MSTHMDTDDPTETVLDLEERFWRGDDAFYDDHLTDDAVMVFAEPIGVLSRAETIQSIADSQRWTDVQFEELRVTELADDVVVLTYHATAVRGDEPPYATLASSVYVADGTSWRLAHHQQTPDGSDAEADTDGRA